jgi:cysteine desulfurase
VCTLIASAASPCYLDHAATTPVPAPVREAMVACLQSDAGNASSVHRAGVRAAGFVERARAQIIARLGGHQGQLLFTSGGTESNNLAIIGHALAGGRRRGHLIISAVEHPSVREPARWLEAMGFTLTLLPVDDQGRVAPEELRGALRPDTVLVSVIHGNNELGTVQDLAALGSACRRAGVPLHSDACQSFTKVPIELEHLPVDMLSINAHKLHGPQGVGALWLRQGLVIEPRQHGGGQEAGLRSGTMNTAGIAGFGAAVQLADDHRMAATAARREQLVSGVLARIPGARLNGPRAGGLPHIASLCFPGVPGKRLFRELDRAGFRVSLGSACAATATQASATLLSIGLTREDALSTLRISPGPETTPAQIELLISKLETLVPQLRASS